MHTSCVRSLPRIAKRAVPLGSQGDLSAPVVHPIGFEVAFQLKAHLPWNARLG